MDALFGFIGFLALIVGIIMGVVALIRKKPKKTAGIVVAAGLVLVIVGLSLPSSSNVVDDGKEKKENEQVAVVIEEDDKVAAEKTEEVTQKDKEKAEKEESEKEQKAKEKAEKEARKTKSVNADWFKTALPAFSEDTLQLQDTSYNFIIENSDLLPAMDGNTISKAKELTDTDTNIKHLNKNATPHFEKFLTAQGAVINVEEDVTEEGQTVAFIHVLDEDFNSHLVIIMKSTGDILEDDTVQFWGVPVGAYSFENVSGGFTNSQMYFGSHIEKK